MNAENQKEITTWRGLAGPFERLLGAQVRRWADDRSASEADAEAAALFGRCGWIAVIRYPGVTRRE